MSDLNAIREDIRMAERSAEIARHVALDHGPELCDEIAELRATIEARDEELMRAGRDNLRLGRAVQNVRDTAERMASVDACWHTDYIRDFMLGCVDGAPDPRRVETAEELDALPLQAVVLVGGGLAVQRDDDGWYAPGTSYTIAEFADDAYPMTVLWLPADGEVDR